MTRLAVVALALVALGATARRPRAFRFEPDAQTELRLLWAASSEARKERVACMAGTILNDTVHVTRIRALTGWGDSLNVSARESLEQCAPPRWQGTIHTHVAVRPERGPYRRFSGADRGVNTMWWRRWNQQGMFCVVFSATDAYCEFDGPEGLTIFPQSTY